MDAMEMRRNAIAELVNKHGTVSFSQIKEQFPNVSEMTLRTDLKALDAAKEIVRIHGGAKSVQLVIGTDDYLTRRSVRNIQAKQEIAKKAKQLILPDTVHEGIVINSAEMRLYYYPKGTNTVIVLPIGIGQLGKDTPINWTTKVERKKAGPTWTPTAKMHAEYRAAGEPLPAVVPAGPDNPMGLYALYIGRLYAIHGTNANFGIGLRVSHGCVRLRNEDIKFLFEKVPVGTRVQFIDEPVKATTEPDGSRYIEVHNPLSTTEAQFEGQEIVPITLTKSVQTVTGQPDVDQVVLDEAIKNRSGMPVRLN